MNIYLSVSFNMYYLSIYLFHYMSSIYPSLSVNVIYLFQYVIYLSLSINGIYISISFNICYLSISFSIYYLFIYLFFSNVFLFVFRWDATGSGWTKSNLDPLWRSSTTPPEPWSLSSFPTLSSAFPSASPSSCAVRSRECYWTSSTLFTTPTWWSTLWCSSSSTIAIAGECAIGFGRVGRGRRGFTGRRTKTGRRPTPAWTVSRGLTRAKSQAAPQSKSEATRPNTRLRRMNFAFDSVWIESKIQRTTEDNCDSAFSSWKS